MLSGSFVNLPPVVSLPAAAAVVTNPNGWQILAIALGACSVILIVISLFILKSHYWRLAEKIRELEITLLQTRIPPRRRRVAPPGVVTTRPQLKVRSLME